MSDTPPPRVAIYVRVSTADQNLDSQLEDVKGYCLRRGWKKIAVYSEKASGANHSRTRLNEMMQDIRAGKIDVVAIWKIDRLGRSVQHLSQIVAELKTLRVGLVSTTQNIDTTDDNPMSKLWIGFLTMISEFDADNIRERTRLGLKYARSKGRVGGRRRENDEELARAQKYRDQGKSFRFIAEKTGLSAGYLCKVLKSPGETNK